MKSSNRNVSTWLALVLTIILMGIFAVYQVQAGASKNQQSPNAPASQDNRPLAGGEDGTPTPSLTPAPALFASETPAPVLFGLDPGTRSDLMVFIEAPVGAVLQPYVILTAYEAVPGTSQISIRGTVNFNQFSCDVPRCALTLLLDSTIVFQPVTRTGETGPQISAFVRVSRQGGRFNVQVESTSPETTFKDSCSEIWAVPKVIDSAWAAFYQSPDAINSDRTYQYLVNKLLTSGVVRAAECPGSGITGGAPNACGLERAAPVAYEWQNRYNYNLWLASRDVGIPPILLKTLIEQESQFWPASAKNYLNEYGLGQMNDLGADVLLRWDVGVYRWICPATLADCSQPYTKLDPDLQAMLRGALIDTLVNVDCPTCQYGLDLDLAIQSVDTLARTLRASCAEVKYILDTYDSSTNYEDFWKLSLASYHSGYGCVEQAIKAADGKNEPANWNTYSRYMTCADSVEYVSRFWSSMLIFERSLSPSLERPVGIPVPTYQPTSTPTLTPTPVLSRSSLRVQVFVDSNNNTNMDPGEEQNSIPVEVNLADGTIFTADTTQGAAVFNLSGKIVGIDVIIRLPGLFRTERISLPETGEVIVNFIFDQPIMPSDLP